MVHSSLFASPYPLGIDWNDLAKPSQEVRPGPTKELRFVLQAMTGLTQPSYVSAALSTHDTFNYTPTLDAAKIFATAEAAVRSLQARYTRYPSLNYNFVLVPVTIETTPARSEQKYVPATVETVVIPAKTIISRRIT